MNREIDEAITTGILTPIADLRMNEEEEEMFNKGLVFEKSHEILTRGHPAILLTARVEKVKERAEFSNYLISPTKFKFEKVVRIIATVWRFVKSFKCLEGKLCRKSSENRPDSKFKMFPTFPVISVIDKSMKEVFEVYSTDYLRTVAGNNMDETENVVDIHRFVNLEFGIKKPGIQFKGKFHIILTDDDYSRCLEYLYKKASNEVKKFNKPELVKKIAIEKDQILFSRNRILDSQRFQVAGGLEEGDILGLGDFGIKVKTPMLDRYSPLSYSIADYVHRKISRHGGYETCLRDSLNHCFIIQGMSLFREIGEDCISCVKRRKKYLDVEMGPIADEQLLVAPPFWVTMCDIFGPWALHGD